LQCAIKQLKKEQIMKALLKISMVAALVGIVFNANAQLSVRAGYVSFTGTTKGQIEGIGFNLKMDALHGFKVGADYSIDLGTFGLAFRPGLNYTFFGGKLDKAVSSRYSFHYLNVPLDLKYAFSFNDDFGIYVLAGPKVALGLSAVAKEEDGGDKYRDNLYTGKWKGTYEGQTQSGKDEGGGSMQRFDLQLGAGVGVQYKALSLEFGYDWGVINMMKTGEDWGENKMRRNQLGVTLGYSF
jgi:hypothetical protein